MNTSVTFDQQGILDLALQCNQFNRLYCLASLLRFYTSFAPMVCSVASLFEMRLDLSPSSNASPGMNSSRHGTATHYGINSSCSQAHLISFRSLARLPFVQRARIFCWRSRRRLLNLTSLLQVFIQLHSYLIALTVD